MCLYRPPPPQHPALLTVARAGRVGILLSRYKSGKLPKAFKIIPSLRNWEQVLFITRPDKWTANACYEATKLFSSQKSAQAQKCASPSPS